MKTKIFIFLVSSLIIYYQGFGQSNITYDAGTNIDVVTGADICADAIIINGSFSGGGTICGGPLPVTLLWFNASVSKNNVKLEWSTGAELNNSGFEVERKPAAQTAEWKKISFIPGNGTTSEPKQYTFDDKKLQTGNYKYRLKQKDFNGNFEFFELENEIIITSPSAFSISQNYPNPSNPKSRIDYQIPFTGRVNIRVYDILGKEVVQLVNETNEAGYYSVEFDGSNLASGVYYYRIIVDGNSQNFAKTLKLILIK